MQSLERELAGHLLAPVHHEISVVQRPRFDITGFGGRLDLIVVERFADQSLRSFGNLDRRIPEAETADEVARLTRKFNALLGRLEQSILQIKRFTIDLPRKYRVVNFDARAAAVDADLRPVGDLRHRAQPGRGRPRPPHARRSGHKLES